MRAPTWALALLLLAIIGIGVYAYFTTPLPFGLSAVIRTPGGSAQNPASSATPAAVGTRTAAGQPLLLGSTSVVVQATQRNQNLTESGRGGPPGSFTVVQIEIYNGGSEPLNPQPAQFRLVDDRGRTYAVDVEASRAVSSATRHRLVFDASVPPSGRTVTLLAFETPTDVGGLTLRVNLGSGEVELPR